VKKIELFRIVVEDVIWTFTSHDVNQIYDSGDGDELYVKTPIDRTEIQSNKEVTKAGVTINIPIDHPFAKYMLITYFEQSVSMTIFEDVNGTVSVFWKGRLASIQPSNTTLSLVFESIFTSLRRPGLRATFQRTCRFALYGKGCELDPDDFDVPATVSAISGNTLTVPEASGQPNGYYLGGMVAAPDGTLSYIIGHTGTTIVLQRISKSLIAAFALTGVGTAIKLYPGCDHSRATCHAKFNNVLNYGGFDWIPTKNPFAESIV
jgi:hypothetical protein